MSPADKEMAVAAVEMIIKHGLPVFMKAVRTLKTDDPTIEDIQALKEQVKDPESYFGVSQARLSLEDTGS